MIYLEKCLQKLFSMYVFYKKSRSRGRENNNQLVLRLKPCFFQFHPVQDL